VPDPRLPLRRRSPLWVQALSSRELHAIAFRFQYERQEADLSAAQEWLWDALISELEWRHRNEMGKLYQCCCELCVQPFPEPD